jgi:hypothetical protein
LTKRLGCRRQLCQIRRCTSATVDDVLPSSATKSGQGWIAGWRKRAASRARPADGQSFVGYQAPFGRGKNLPSSALISASAPAGLLAGLTLQDRYWRPAPRKLAQSGESIGRPAAVIEDAAYGVAFPEAHCRVWSGASLSCMASPDRSVVAPETLCAPRLSNRPIPSTAAKPH